MKTLPLIKFGVPEKSNQPVDSVLKFFMWFRLADEVSERVSTEVRLSPTPEKSTQRDQGVLGGVRGSNGGPHE